MGILYALLTTRNDDYNPETPLTTNVTRRLAAYPRVTLREEVHSTLEFRLRPLVAEERRTPKCLCHA